MAAITTAAPPATSTFWAPPPFFLAGASVIGRRLGRAVALGQRRMDDSLRHRRAPRPGSRSPVRARPGRRAGTEGANRSSFVGSGLGSTLLHRHLRIGGDVGHGAVDHAERLLGLLGGGVELLEGGRLLLARDRRLGGLLVGDRGRRPRGFRCRWPTAGRAGQGVPSRRSPGTVATPYDRPRRPVRPGGRPGASGAGRREGRRRPPAGSAAVAFSSPGRRGGQTAMSPGSPGRSPLLAGHSGKRGRPEVAVASRTGRALRRASAARRRVRRPAGPLLRGRPRTGLGVVAGLFGLGIVGGGIGQTALRSRVSSVSGE